MKISTIIDSEFTIFTIKSLNPELFKDTKSEIRLPTTVDK